MQDIEWRNVVGYEELFSVNSIGEVFSKRTNKKLKQYTDKKGYKTVATKIGGRQGINLCFKVHRLVAEAFIPNPENKPYVNHIDGDSLNNQILNLQVCNQATNMKNVNTKNSQHQGVSFHKRSNSWQARWQENSKQKCKSFSVKKFGENAFYMALNHRKESST